MGTSNEQLKVIYYVVLNKFMAIVYYLSDITIN